MGKPVEERVVANYRAALKASTLPRAAARRARALRVTAERYHLPVGEVKRTVRAASEAEGVSHEHDPAYLTRLEVSRRGGALEEEHGDSPCSCGGGFEVRVRVVYALDSDRSERRVLGEDGVPLLSRSCYYCWSLLGTELGSGWSVTDLAELRARIESEYEREGLLWSPVPPVVSS